MIKLETTTAYTVEQAGELLHLSAGTIRRYIASGKIRAQKVGRRYYVTEQTITDFINGDSKK